MVESGSRCLGRHRDAKVGDGAVTIYEADVPAAVFDEHRRVMVLPVGLTGREWTDAVDELVQERSGGARSRRNGKTVR